MISGEGAFYAMERIGLIVFLSGGLLSHLAGACHGGQFVALRRVADGYCRIWRA